MGNGGPDPNGIKLSRNMLTFQFVLQLVAGLGHAFVGFGSPFDNTGFEAPGTTGDEA